MGNSYWSTLYTAVQCFCHIKIPYLLCFSVLWYNHRTNKSNFGTTQLEWGITAEYQYRWWLSRPVPESFDQYRLPCILFCTTGAWWEEPEGASQRCYSLRLSVHCLSSRGRTSDIQGKSSLFISLRVTVNYVYQINNLHLWFGQLATFWDDTQTFNCKSG